MRFLTLFTFVLVGSNFLPPADPAAGPTYIVPTFTCTVANVHDGDTIQCAERGADGRRLRVRVSGIDARELDGSCAPGHPCASASPEAATATLERLVSGQRLQCRFEGYSYRRLSGFCVNGAGLDVSCAMLASGTVAKWERYWGDHQCR